jgi:MtN3 and saliva related transmembrane protein
MLEQIIGYIASLLTIISSLPQLIKIITTQQSKDVSLETYVILIIGQTLWVIYGILINAMEIIICNIISVFISISVLSVGIFFRYKNNIEERVTEYPISYSLHDVD